MKIICVLWCIGGNGCLHVVGLWEYAHIVCGRIEESEIKPKTIKGLCFVIKYCKVIFNGSFFSCTVEAKYHSS